MRSWKTGRKRYFAGRFFCLISKGMELVKTCNSKIDTVEKKNDNHYKMMKNPVRLVNRVNFEKELQERNWNAKT